MNILKKIANLRLIDYLQMIEAVFFLVISNILIFGFPFRWWHGWIGKKNKENHPQPLPQKDIQSLKRIQHNVRRANKILFNTSKCFAISLTLKKMLHHRAYPATLYLGVKRKEQNLLAHAWLKYGNWVLYGGREADNHYTQLICFTWLFCINKERADIRQKDNTFMWV